MLSDPIPPPTLFPQIPQGLIPLLVKEVGHLLKLRVFHSVAILAPLLQSERGLRFAVGMVKDMRQLPDNTVEAVPTTFILAFQCAQRLLFLHRYLAGLLEGAPTPVASPVGADRTG